MHSLSKHVAAAFTALQVLNTIPITARRTYCAFGEPCWPSIQEWASFNASISGRLISPLPPAAVCHDPTYNEAACTLAKTNWSMGAWRLTQPGAYQQINWENGDARCFIDTPKEEPCEQGLVPVLAVAAETADDIQKSVKFASKNKLNLVVKNTGHDYLGRSSGAGSFAIWTHKMKGIDFQDEFKPSRCPRSLKTVPAMTVGAGESWIDVYGAAHVHGVTVVGGAGRSVGAAGGYVLGGGHSPLGHLYGMAVDNVIQFTVVTASGEHVAANECTNKDLFWALRGGGGSNWGVVTSVTYKTHPALQNMLLGFLEFQSNDTQVMTEFNKFFFEFIPNMVDAGFRAYPFLASNYTRMITFQSNSPSDPGRTGDHTIANATFAPLFERVASLPSGSSVISHQWIMLNSFFEFIDQTIPDGYLGEVAWIGSRIITRDVFAEQAAALATACAEMTQIGMISLNIVGGGAVHAIKAGETPLHPVWRQGGLASLNLSSGWPKAANSTVKHQIQSAVTNMMRGLDTIIGESAGAYFNEADPLEPKWKQAFWGSNYGRLLDIKRNIDPTGVFTCNRCAGSNL